MKQDYYKRKLYKYLEPPNFPYIENKISNEVLDRIHCVDSRNLDFIPSSSVHLIITSPPYNVGMDYDNDLERDEFKLLLKNVFRECYLKLVPGGRICINIANIGRKPYLDITAFIADIMFRSGYYMRGEIIWDKLAIGVARTAWGSWMSATNPVLRDEHEYIMVFCKAPFNLKTLGRKSSITRDEFLEYTRSIWHIAPESAKRVGHPAPFPIELPARLIKLYSFEDNVILDPFCGSGTTCIAARQLSRHFIGIDNCQAYVDLANKRLLANVTSK